MFKTFHTNDKNSFGMGSYIIITSMQRFCSRSARRYGCFFEAFGFEIEEIVGLIGVIGAGGGAFLNTV